MKMFLIGAMSAYLPSMIVLAYILWRTPADDKPTVH